MGDPRVEPRARGACHHAEHAEGGDVLRREHCRAGETVDDDALAEGEVHQVAELAADGRQLRLARERLQARPAESHPATKEAMTGDPGVEPEESLPQCEGL